jgi:phosphatidylglycerol:prolipoprotein diacylglycerol transferase
MGRPCDCFLAIDSPDGPRLEMAIFEIIGLLPLAILFYLKRNKRVSERWFTATLFIYYGVLRFILDFFRATDIAAADARYLGLTPAQYFGILLVGTGIFFLYKKKKAHS